MARSCAWWTALLAARWRGRRNGGQAVTAAMDEMAFLAPVHVGDILRASAQVNWAGRSSMEVGVRVMSEPWNRAGIEQYMLPRRTWSS
ncbi:MAG: acyl-CoA thioesterase [Marmoricola sp.]